MVEPLTKERGTFIFKHLSLTECNESWCTALIGDYVT